MNIIKLYVDKRHLTCYCFSKRLIAVKYGRWLLGKRSSNQVTLHICTSQCKISCFLLDIFSVIHGVYLILQMPSQLQCWLSTGELWTYTLCWVGLIHFFNYSLYLYPDWLEYGRCFLSCLFLTLIEGFSGAFGIGSPWINWNLFVRQLLSWYWKVLLIFLKPECKEVPYQSLSFNYFGNCQSEWNAIQWQIGKKSSRF